MVTRGHVSDMWTGFWSSSAECGADLVLCCSQHAAQVCSSRIQHTSGGRGVTCATYRH